MNFSLFYWFIIIRRTNQKVITMNNNNKILEQKSHLIRTSRCNSIQIDIDGEDDFEIQSSINKEDTIRFLLKTILYLYARDDSKG